MLKMVFKRLLAVLPVLVGISILSFLLIDAAPGDPVELMLRQSGGDPDPLVVERLKGDLGVDKPFPIRYWKWVCRAARLDFGTSLVTGEDVLTELAARMPETIKLSGAAFIFSLLGALFVGIFSGVWQNKGFDHLGRLWAIFSMSLPNYWLGLILLYLFAIKYQFFQIIGSVEHQDIILPSLTLGLHAAAANSRLVRERVIEIMSRDYIKLAIAKGLPMPLILIRHVANNVLIPMVMIWAMSFGYLLGGSVIVESVFAWPGMGKLAVDAITSRDFPVLQGYVVLMALIFISLNLIADLLHLLLDPRIRRTFRD